MRFDASSADEFAIEVRDAANQRLAATGDRHRAAVRIDDIDPAQLLIGLDPAARLRLARYVLDVCATVFQLGGESEFVAACRLLVNELSQRPGALVPRCTVLDQAVLCEGLVPPELGGNLSAITIGAHGIRRAMFAPAMTRALGKAQDRVPLTVLLDKAVASGDSLVVILGDNGLACRRFAVDANAAPPALGWIRTPRANPESRRYLLDCLARLGAEDPRAAALLREMQVLAPSRGRVVNDKHCPVTAGADLIIGTEAGVFITGWLADRHHLIETIELDRAGRTTQIALPSLVRFAHPRAPGSDAGFAVFAATQSGVAADAACRLSLRLRSGHVVPVADGPSILAPHEAREAVLRAVPRDHLSSSAIGLHIEPAVAALQARHLAERPIAEVIEIGAGPDRPQASVVVPLGSDADILRCRLGMLATDPTMRGVEIVHVLEAPQQRVAVERSLRALNAAYGVACRLVVMPGRFQGGAALNAGALAARAPLLVFLGADVVPEEAGWLDRLTTFLADHPRCGVAGTRLVFEDRSLANAGATLTSVRGGWDVMRLCRGFPRDFGAAAGDAKVDVVLAGCLAIGRSLFERVGGFAEDYLSPLYRDADLCLRVAKADQEIWRVAEPALFQLGAEEVGDGENDLRAELDRRALEQRWRLQSDAQQTEPEQTIGIEPARARIGRRRRRAA